MIATSVLDTIGRTPHIRLGRLFPDAEVWVKSERANPGGSIKDRIALAMVEAAEQDGRLKPGGVIIEPTSGNTGIGLAMVAAVKGYKLILVMPESMSVERRRLMLSYGATFDLTPRERGMTGAIERAQALAAETTGAWIPQQFENPANIAIHVATTAQEILADFPDGLDALITGVGTGGHLTGCAQVLKEHWPELKAFAVEPSQSPVISGGAPSPHPIQGIGAGFVPANLHTALLDGVIQVSADDAKEYARRSASREGLLVGISSGATLAAIASKLPELRPGARVLGFNYDTGERYLWYPTSSRCDVSHLRELFHEHGAGFSDALWGQLRREAEEAFAGSPTLAPLFLDSIINQPSFEAAIFHRIAGRLKNDVISHLVILQAFHRAAAATPEISLGLNADIAAVFDRDPACERLIEPFLYFKGFHTLQAHRLTYWLWQTGERDFALYLQSRASEVFQTDIHPAVRIGRGIFLDHATGLVVGETTVIGDDVSLLQDVTLGGSGNDAGDRHPKIDREVMIGAGAKILGNIKVGENARIAAGSVVLAAVPPGATVAGVPARVVRTGTTADRPVAELLHELSYSGFDYAI